MMFLQEKSRSSDALELLELMRIKCSEITRAHATFTEAYLGGSVYQNLTIGGVDKYGNPSNNELSELILQSGINVKTWQPTISVRWTESMSEKFKHKVVDCIKAGSGYPALFNDEIAIDRFMKNSHAFTRRCTGLGTLRVRGYADMRKTHAYVCCSTYK